jgi:hypothetical protein
MLVSWRIGCSLARMKDTTGAPRRSKPKAGMETAYLPSNTSAVASSWAASTAPWPPRP